jgi:hypothetical protein
VIFLISLAAALAPANFVPHVAPEYLRTARDRWLLCTLFLTIVAMMYVHEYWLAAIGAWFLWRWDGPQRLESLVCWIGVGASWFLLRQLDADTFTRISYAWVVWGLAQVALLTWQWHKGTARPPGTYGSPPTSANFLALTIFFAPWWLWPVFAWGLWLTSSFLAILAVGVASFLLVPAPTSFVLGFGMVVFVSERYSSHHDPDKKLTRWLDAHTIRGMSTGTVRGRWMTWRLLLSRLTLAGVGGGHMPRQMVRWSTEIRTTEPRSHLLPPGEAHFELGQIAYEYGLLGLAAALLFLWPLVQNVNTGDAWSAAFVSGCILSLGHWPIRHPAVGLLFLAVCAGVLTR